jgi:hypothetical protein
MILTKNNDCTEILIQSDLFHNNNVSNILTINVNGGIETEEITLGASILSYTLTPADLSKTEFLPGVYEITLTSVLASTTIQVDLGCTALLCDYACDQDTLNLYADSTNLDKILAYEGLKNFADCTSCSCSLANTLHDAFLNSTTTNAPSCGCG